MWYYYNAPLDDRICVTFLHCVLSNVAPWYRYGVRRAQMWCYNASLDGAGGGFRGQMAKQASQQGLTASLAPHAHFPQRLPAYLNFFQEKAFQVSA